MSKTIIDKIQPEGFIKEYLEYASELTDACKEFHLAVALTSLSSCIGSRILYPDYGGDRRWPNLYTLLLGPSGISRKTTCVRMGQKMVNSVEPLLIADGIETREKFMSYLQAQPNVLWPIFEFSSVLGNWQRSYADGYKEFVTDIFDPVDKRHRRILGSKRDDREGTITIEKAAVNILAASTPEWLAEKLTEGDLRGGLMGRFIIFPHGVKQTDPGLNPIVDKDKRDSLVEYLKKINTMANSWVDITMVMDIFNKWDVKNQRKLMEDYNPDLVGFQSRVSSHALKLSVLFCVSESPIPLVKYILTEKHMKQGILLAEWLTEETLGLAKTGFVKSRTEQQVQKMISLASRNGGIQRTDALQLMHITAREFDQVIQTIVERGQIKIERQTSSTKPVYWYTAVKQAETEETEG